VGRPSSYSSEVENSLLADSYAAETILRNAFRYLGNNNDFSKWCAKGILLGCWIDVMQERARRELN
jgi:hypothetical protein